MTRPPRLPIRLPRLPSLLALLAFALVLLPSGGCGGKPKTGPAPELVIFASGSLWGYIEPCGCEDGMGGFVRRAGAMNGYRAKHPDIPWLYLDAGRAFPMKTTETDVVVPHMKQSLEMLGLDLINVTDDDLEAGLSPYASMSQDARYATVSANLVSIDDGRPFFAPYKVLTPHKGTGRVESPRVAVIGVARADRYEVMDGIRGGKLHFIDVEKALAEWLPQARAEADIVIVLTNVGAGIGRLLANKYPDIDAMITCDETDDTVARIAYGETQVITTGTRGKYDIRLELFRREGPRPWRIDMVSTPLDDRAPSDESARAFLAGFRATLTATNERRGELARKDPSEPAYVGSAACFDCHGEAATAWQASKHALAWETLERTKNTMNPLCLHCHTVGYLKPNGFVMASNDKELVDVGCESCHGPGGPHVQDPTGAAMEPGGEANCRTCHTGGQTPDFDFETYWPKIRH